MRQPIRLLLTALLLTATACGGSTQTTGDTPDPQEQADADAADLADQGAPPPSGDTPDAQDMGQDTALADLPEDEPTCQDSDGDQACDEVDNCPEVANADQIDTDGDALGDACDEDDDDDGFDDANEAACGSDPTLVGDTPTDADSDFYCDALDNCPDTANADQIDTDGDALGDACDDDDDEDGFDDANEAACGSDPVDATSKPSDGDGDATCDALDNCPEVANNDQIDTDGDALGDACDEDDDNDGFDDATELRCGADPADATSQPPDTDGDALCDALDNCPEVANADQTDTDGDDEGDACDEDDDNDGFGDANEVACGSDPTLVGDTPADADGDALCDALDNCPEAANADQINTDGDALGDACDDDDDNDGFGDANEAACGGDPVDADSVPTDTDGDALCDALDNCPEVANADQLNTDEDEFGDACDEDDDDDGVDDATELRCGADPLDADETIGDSDQDGVCDPDDNCAMTANPDQADSERGFDCGSGDCEDLSGCFYVDQDARTLLYCPHEMAQADAQSFCQQLGGALLVAEQAQETDLTTAPGLEVWIGLGDVAQEGAFTWVDGEPLGEDRWGEGQPDPQGANKDCVGQSYDGLWYNISCSFSLPFFCQAPSAPDGVGDACDTCPALAAPNADSDGDGVGDACDACPQTPDLGSDQDGDGVDDACDNCPQVANADQADGDGDGTGDACQEGHACTEGGCGDLLFCDAQGQCQAPSSCPTQDRFEAEEATPLIAGRYTGLTACDQEDSYQIEVCAGGHLEVRITFDQSEPLALSVDGVTADLGATEQRAYAQASQDSAQTSQVRVWPQSDGQGGTYTLELTLANCIDTDMDGEFNGVDLDDDGDGTPDTVEEACGSDPLDPESNLDMDGDGVCDAEDNCPSVSNPYQEELREKQPFDCGLEDCQELTGCSYLSGYGQDYLDCDQSLTWEEAEAFCQQLGGHLLSINSQEEEELASRYNTRGWLGLHDQLQEGDFVWSDGSPVNFLNWNDGEPNDSNGEDCAVMRRAGDSWNDAGCEGSRAFICETSVVQATDGVGDACDLCPEVVDDGQDSDGDGIGDACDACPEVAASGQDSDGDGADDTCDNCLGVSNPDQGDEDGDGAGDACDPDFVCSRDADCGAYTCQEGACVAALACPDDDSHEPNGGQDQASALEPGVYGNQTLCQDDQDYYGFTLCAGGTASASVSYSGTASESLLVALFPYGEVFFTGTFSIGYGSQEVLQLENDGDQDQEVILLLQDFEESSSLNYEIELSTTGCAQDR